MGAGGNKNRKGSKSGKNSKETLQTLLCLPECSYGGKQGDCEMLRCCSCMKWVHPICCGDDPSEDPENIPTIYNCSICRSLSERVSNLEKQIETLTELNQKLIKLLEKNNSDYIQLQNMLPVSKVCNHTCSCPSATTNTKDDFQKMSERTSETDCMLIESSPKQQPQQTQRLLDQPSTKHKALNPEAPPFWSVSPHGSIPGRRAIVPVEEEQHTSSSNPIPNVDISPQVKRSPQVQMVTQVQQPTHDQKSPQNINSRMRPKQTPGPITRNPHHSTRTAAYFLKPKLTLVGSSMARNTGKFISSALPEMHTCVCSTSGLTLGKAINQVPKSVVGYDIQDTIVLNLGTPDVEYYDHLDITEKYSILLDKIKAASPECKIVVCAVPYRLDGESVKLNETIDNLNRALRLLCVRQAIVLSLM